MNVEGLTQANVHSVSIIDLCARHWANYIHFSVFITDLRGTSTLTSSCRSGKVRKFLTILQLLSGEVGFELTSVFTESESSCTTSSLSA